MIKRLLAAVAALAFLLPAPQAVQAQIPTPPSGGGSGCTVSGSSGQLVYNNGSSGCSSASGVTTDGTSLTVASGSQTANYKSLNITQTWNNSGITFDAPLFMNVTNTASGAASELMDIQVGGVSFMSLSKPGGSGLTIGSNGAPGSLVLLNSSGQSVSELIGNGAGLLLSSGQTVNWQSTANLTGSTDTGLSRDSAGVVDVGNGTQADKSGTVQAAVANIGTGGKLTSAASATLHLGAADAASPVSQTLGVQGVVAGTSNTAGANFVIAGSQGTGTGAGGSIVLQYAPAGTTGTSQNALANGVTMSGADGSLTLAGTKPTLSGTCTTGSQLGGASAGSFTATCTAQTVIMTFKTTAPNGWVCQAQDQTTIADTLKQSANSTTSCTLTGTTAASDVIVYTAFAY